MNTTENKFYIYAWYYKDTNEIFYIGKGCNNRYCDLVHSRNNYFKNIIAKEGNNVTVKFLYENLFEVDALSLERQLIHKYWDLNQCKANLHEGGAGGNTGNYDNPERSRKLSIAASKRIGPLNSMYGKTHTQEVRKKLSEINKGKHLSEEHKQKLIKANTGRKKTQKEIDNLKLKLKGRKLSKSNYEGMMKSQTKYAFKIFVENILVYWCIGHTKLNKFCENVLYISRTIINQIKNGNYVPKFKKHQYLKNIKIEVIDRSVSTNRDEFNGVEWRLTPFEVRGNQFYFG